MIIFLDANILFAASANPNGGSSRILEIAAQGKWILTTSKLAVFEAERNIERKLSLAAKKRFKEIIDGKIKIVEEPPEILIKQAAKHINIKDASILASAIEQRADYLLTFDRKHFFIVKVQTFASRYSIIIATPGQLL